MRGSICLEGRAKRSGVCTGGDVCSKRGLQPKRATRSGAVRGRGGSEFGERCVGAARSCPEAVARLPTTWWKSWRRGYDPDLSCRDPDRSGDLEQPGSDRPCLRLLHPGGVEPDRRRPGAQPCYTFDRPRARLTREWSRAGRGSR